MPAPGNNPSANQATVVILDMSAVIHIVNPQRENVFGEYAPMQLLPYLNSQMNNSTTRIDAVWDTYQDDSLKAQTHAKRGEAAEQQTQVSKKANTLSQAL